MPVKFPKKPSKEPPLPSQDESRRTNVLFEKLMSEFRTVGESVSAIRERVDRIEPKLDKRGEDIEILKAAARSHTDAIRANAEDVRSLKDAVQGNTEDIRSLKEAVQGNTEAIRGVQTDLKKYDQRLELVEAKNPS